MVLGYELMRANSHKIQLQQTLSASSWSVDLIYKKNGKNPEVHNQDNVYGKQNEVSLKHIIWQCDSNNFIFIYFYFCLTFFIYFLFLFNAF